MKEKEPLVSSDNYGRDEASAKVSSSMHWSSRGGRSDVSVWYGEFELRIHVCVPQSIVRT